MGKKKSLHNQAEIYFEGQLHLKFTKSFFNKHNISKGHTFPCC